MGVHAKCVTVAKKNHFDDEFYPLGKHFEDVPSTYEDDGKQRQKNAESPQSKIWSLSQQNPLNVLFFLFNLLLKVMRNKSFCSRKSLCVCVCVSVWFKGQLVPEKVLQPQRGFTNTITLFYLTRADQISNKMVEMWEMLGVSSCHHDKMESAANQRGGRGGWKGEE